MAVATPAVSKRPPLWRNVRVRRWALQALFLLALAAFVLWVYNNLTDNLRAANQRTDFTFLRQQAGFAIPDPGFSSAESIFQAFLVGAKNTAKVAFLGILLATVLGVLVGVARLSTNWLVRRAAAIYVETLRNIRVLVIILFWYLGVLLAVLAVAVIAAAAVAIWRTRRFDRTGEPHRRVLWAGGILVVGVVVGFFASGMPFGLSLPERGEFTTTGGFRLSPEYGALLIALTLYTASHIAEIVRGSILAVPRGQGEAADAVGLTPFERLRYVVLPQAFRISVPPVANQYLNLTKNSSLGVAIGYYELTRVTGISISQASPAPQAIFVLMLFYLAFSLFIALVTNLINRRLEIKAR
jgi:general L-amino acid transport system permease protein